MSTNLACSVVPTMESCPNCKSEMSITQVISALALPSVQERLAKIGVEKLPMTVAEFDRFFKDDVANNLELVKAANIPRQ